MLNNCQQLFVVNSVFCQVLRKISFFKTFNDIMKVRNRPLYSTICKILALKKINIKTRLKHGKLLYFLMCINYCEAFIVNLMFCQVIKKICFFLLLRLKLQVRNRAFPSGKQGQKFLVGTWNRYEIKDSKTQKLSLKLRHLRHQVSKNKTYTSRTVLVLCYFDASKLQWKKINRKLTDSFILQKKFFVLGNTNENNLLNIRILSIQKYQYNKNRYLDFPKVPIGFSNLIFYNITNTSI